MKIALLSAACLYLGLSTLWAAEPALVIRILYDNTSANSAFEADWGFSALVKTGDQVVLFDSGADPDILEHNMAQISLDPASIPVAVISHHHMDHRGGIYRLGLKNHSMKVYFLDTFPKKAFDIAYAVGLDPRRVKGPQEIVPGIYTTGIVEGNPPEQALVVDTPKGLVVLVGCSHPGVARMVEAAEKQLGKNSVRLVLGGFHMIRQSEDEIQAQIERLKELNVEKVAPAHCTGEKAARLFRQAWGADFVPAGAGRKIVLE